MLRKVVRLFDISIHAPCEGGDADRMRPLSKTGYFNPRPLRGGRQSRFTRTLFTKNISIHAPCEGGDLNLTLRLSDQAISIHAPCEGGDGDKLSGCPDRYQISIHAPCEGGDAPGTPTPIGTFGISIHAPCEGGDVCNGRCDSGSRHFNPRPLRGGRLLPKGLAVWSASFQSTPPARGATTPTKRSG